MKKLTIKKAEKIAKKTYSSIETLKTQNSDALDFHIMAVWKIKEMIFEAYKAGQNSTKTKKKMELIQQKLNK